MTERTSTPKRAPAKRKPAAKAKAPAKRKSCKPPARNRWEPATSVDYSAVEEALAKAAAATERATPMTAAERVERDSAIVAAHVGRGLRLATVAKTVGLSERQARRIVDEYRDSRARLAFPDSMTVLFDCLEAIESGIEEAAMFASSKANNESARVGAMRLRREMQVDRLQLLMHMGIVRPDAHAQVRYADFMRRFADGLQALRSTGVAEEQIAAMQAAMEAGGAEVISLADVRGTAS